MHQPDQLLGHKGKLIYRALLNLKEKDLVSNLGISIYHPEQLDKILGIYKFDLVQSPFNVLDRRIIDSGWASKLKERGIELHARSIFLQGLLLMNDIDRMKKFHRWNKLWTEWNIWLKFNEITAVYTCINFALQNQYIDKVIIGFQNEEQLNQILKNISNKPLHVPDWSKYTDENLLNPSNWDSL